MSDVLPPETLGRVDNLLKTRMQVENQVPTLPYGSNELRAAQYKLWQIDSELEQMLGSGDDAKRILAEIRHASQADVRKRGAKEQGIQNIAMGIGCLSIAGIVSLLSYLFASGGDTYYVFWGGMAFGGYLIVRGIVALRRE